MSDECSFCQDLQVVKDIEHILCECPALSQRRLEELGAYFLLPQELVDIRTSNIIMIVRKLSCLVGRVRDDDHSYVSSVGFPMYLGH